jgi:putative tryptophan/tyrosine transport system substrate-binding protein
MSARSSQLGLVASLNRPGGNLTGVTNLNVEVGQKRLELLRELMPAAANIAVLVNPSAPAVTEQFMGAL